MHRYRAVLALLLPFALVACSKDTESNRQPPQHQPAPAPASAGNSTNDGLYRSSCAPCHGATGKGQGAMRIPNLSSVAWQQRVSDEEIAEVITKGRGKMPAFNLPPNKVDGLVKKVRSFK